MKSDTLDRVETNSGAEGGAHAGIGAEDQPGAEGKHRAQRRSSEAAEYRYDAAQRIAERGLGVAGTAAERSALECFRGGVLHDLGNMELARGAYEAALAAAGDGVARCWAWIGLAAVKRVTGDVAGAVAALTSAETEAEPLDLVAEQARIHYMCGNLCFPGGDWEGCLREHGAALEHARQVNMVELEATALGGLGDAEYMRGRMISAHARFGDCVATCARHGMGRIEAANMPMIAFTGIFSGTMRDALALAEEVIRLAARVGHLRGKLIAHHAAWWCRHALTDFAAAREDAEAALSLSRQLGLPTHPVNTSTVRAFERRRPSRKPFPEHLPRERVVMCARDAFCRDPEPVVEAIVESAVSARIESPGRVPGHEALTRYPDRVTIGSRRMS